MYFFLVRKVLKSITNIKLLKFYSTIHFNNLGNLSLLKVSKKAEFSSVLTRTSDSTLFFE